MLKKPSQFFNSDRPPIQESFNNIDKNSEAFQSLKQNIGKINSIYDVSETLEQYRQSVDEVNTLSKEVEGLREELKKFLTTEDLDRAMMGQCVLIDQTISDVQKKVKTINNTKLVEIREEVTETTNQINEFLEQELPKYRRLFFDSEVRNDKKYEQYKESVNASFENSVKEFENHIDEVKQNVEQLCEDVTSRVSGINSKSLSDIIENVKELGEKQESKYKKIILDGQVSEGRKYQQLEENVNSRCDDLASIIGELTEKVSLFEGDNTDIVNTLNEKINDVASIKKSFSNVKKSFAEQSKNFENYTKEIVEEVESLKVDIARNESHIKNQEAYVVGYEGYKQQIDEKINHFKQEITRQQVSDKELREAVQSYQDNLDEELKQIAEKVVEQQTYNEYYQGKAESRQEKIESFTESYRKEIESKVSDIQKDILRSDADLRIQNSNIADIKESVQSAIKKLNYDEIEKKNYQLASKIKYLEEVFEKFNQRQILNESIITEPPTVNNGDPLTPLDQNFVTFDQLNSHYKTFINRIQQQLSTLGGGGETRLEFLDDVDRDSVKVDGKVLAYQASTGKFIGVTNAGGGGGSGITTAEVRDAIQGYYGYTTDYYTVGVANTVQTIGAGVTTLIQPQVAAVYQYMPTIMSDVSTNPYVGSGATIGTGQTEFSLAGLSSGASCIVRVALAFNPDEDNTNLDIQLKFTTNTATQGTGLTNFVTLKENALIMTTGGDQQYISENVFSFFVGTTLEGTTQENAGSFSIEVIPSNDGELEVLAVTVNVVA